MTRERSFYSKILLFGEYSVILDSMALSSPYPLFEGMLGFKRERQKLKDPELAALAQYLKNLEKKRELDFELDVASFAFDIGQGLVFDSSIPQGYGVGSSGALCAAVYDRYATSSEENKENIGELKRRLALIESHFHSSSSGIDPLISYLGHPILIRSGGEVGLVDLPKIPKGEGAIFLLDTGRSRKTEPLVNLFLEKCKYHKFKKFCQQDLLPVTNACVTHFLEGDIQKLEASFRELSFYQLDHFRPMIPKLYHEVWKHGLDSREYYLKLCGAGGGGFFLGFTCDFKEAMQELEGYEIRPLFHF